MKEHVVTSIRLTAVLLVLACGIYPGVVWAIGQLAFHDKANGSLIERNGTVIGSELIGQSFAGAAFFHPRPSAAGTGGYDATASGGTNLGPTSKKLRDEISASVASLRKGGVTGPIAADSVTSSASGLDPHISPENALSQAPRVAAANRMTVDEVTRLIEAREEGRFADIFGEPRVNVLLLNLDLLKARKRVVPMKAQVSFRALPPHPPSAPSPPQEPWGRRLSTSKISTHFKLSRTFAPASSCGGEGAEGG